MIIEHDYKVAKALLPKHIQKYIQLGHVDVGCIDDDDLIILRSVKLTSEKFINYVGEDLKQSIQYSIDGAEVEGEGFGVHCIIIDEEWYYLPEHFMNTKEIYDFIQKCLKNHSELLI